MNTQPTPPKPFPWGYLVVWIAISVLGIGGVWRLVVACSSGDVDGVRNAIEPPPAPRRQSTEEMVREAEQAARAERLRNVAERLKQHNAATEQSAKARAEGEPLDLDAIRREAAEKLRVHPRPEEAGASRGPATQNEQERPGAASKPHTTPPGQQQP